MSFVSRVVAVWLCFFSILCLAQAPILGVLEDVPKLTNRNPELRAVRVVFEKEGAEWEAFPSDCRVERCLLSVVGRYPQKVTWNVSFQGQSLGNIVTIRPYRFNSYAEIGLEKPESVRPIPTVGERAQEYGGYTGAAVYRPLISSSQALQDDPAGWKESALSVEQINQIRRSFRKHFGKLCQLERDQLKPLPYTDNDLGIVTAYASRDRWAIARVHLKDAVDCADTEAGFEIDDSWFVVDPQMKVRHLDDGMWLVDAGDYDNDGHSELVFSIDRDNRGGYILFYDSFQKKSVFEYSYH